jgi:GNAT superfamily N-acetyltransferase
MGCARVRVPGAIAHTYPIDRSGTFYNFVLVQDPRSFVLEDVETVYAKSKLPFAIRIPRLEFYGELKKTLCEHGYLLVPVWNLMTHEKWIGARNPEVEVDDIDRSRLMDWFELQDVFNHVESSRATRMEMVERISTKRSVQLLMASINDRPVGAGLLFLKHRVASIHMIATLPDYRRKRVASTITLEALRRAQNEKVDLVWLRTRRGGIGEKVYSKLGFKAFSDILSYTKTPEFEDSNLPPK